MVWDDSVRLGLTREYPGLDRPAIIEAVLWQTILDDDQFAFEYKDGPWGRVSHELRTTIDGLFNYVPRSCLAILPFPLSG